MKSFTVLLCLCIALASGFSTTGNAQFRDAVNAALSEIFQSGEWATFADQYPVGLRTQNCAPSTDYYPYPANPTGTLQDIFTRGAMRLAVSFSAPPYSFLDSNNQVTGFEVLLWTRVAQRLGLHYKSSASALSIEWSNTAGLPFFLLVENGTADAMVGATSPGIYNDTTKVTSSEYGNMACSHYSASVSALAGPTFTSTISLSTLNNANVKIGSQIVSVTNRNIAATKLPNVDMTLFQAPNNPTLYDWLKNGTIDVVVSDGATNEYFRTSYLGGGSEYQTLSFGTSFMRSFLTRRDATQEPAPSRTQAADGDEQLQMAFQASLADLYKSGEWGTMASQYNVGETIQDCAAGKGSDWYPYPQTPLMNGNLKEVLDTRTLRLCYNNGAPYITYNSAGDVNGGFYYTLAQRFVSDLQTKYGGNSIGITWHLSTESPTLTMVFNNTCHGYMGSIIPGSLGTIDGRLWTSADRLYQSCSINADAIVIVAGPSYTGTFTLPTLQALSASTQFINLASAVSSREYVKNYLPGKDYTIQFANVADMFESLNNGTYQFAIAQDNVAKSYISNFGSNAANFRILTLYVEQLFSISFYKNHTTSVPDSSSSASFYTSGGLLMGAAAFAALNL